MDKGGFGNRTAEIYLEVRREGVLVGTRLASVAPCQEDALFNGVLVGRIPNDGGARSYGVTPIWSGMPNPPEVPPEVPPEAPGLAGAPSVTGVELRRDDAPSRRYGREIFASQARALTDSLVAEGKLAAGASVEWSLAEGPPAPATSGFRVRVSREPFPLTPTRLPELALGEIAVELDAALLDRLRREFCHAGAVERAWLLVGSVDHDVERGAAAIRGLTAVAVEVGRGGASRTHFAFEPRPFVEAREKALRDYDGLVPIGWAHSHPPCEACPANPDCQSDTRFFSADDVEVHTSAFASPYMIALVVGKVATAPATEPGFHLYGWRDALVTKLDYRVVNLGNG